MVALRLSFALALGTPVGCGRIGFDQVDADLVGDTSGDGSSGGSPMVETVSVGGTTGDVKSLTISGHVVRGGENRILIVGAGMASSSDDLMAVTYNGAPLRLLRGFHGYFYNDTELWYLVMGSSTTATTADIVLTESVDSRPKAAIAMSFTGVDQSTPFGTWDHYGDTATTQPTTAISIASAPGEVVVDLFVLSTNAALDFTGSDVVTAGPGQNERGRVQDTGGARSTRALMSTVRGQAATPMTWSFTPTYDHGHIAASLRPAP